MFKPLPRTNTAIAGSTWLVILVDIRGSALAEELTVTASKNNAAGTIARGFLNSMFGFIWGAPKFLRTAV
ncbi:hypothetical protein WAE31_03000 (plasmid) [Xanthomonas axonopodis pv. vasculorum]